MVSSSYQVPVTQTNYAKILVEVFTEYDLDIHQLLKDSGLPPDLIQSDSDFVPSESIKRLIYLTYIQLGVTGFIDLLRFALRKRIIPHVLHQFTEYSTIGGALNDINKIFLNDTPSSNVHFEIEHGEYWFCVYAPTKACKYFQWSEAFALTYIIELVSMLTGRSWQPDKVKLQNCQIDIIRSFLPISCQLYIDQEKTAVKIPTELLNNPIDISSQFLSLTSAIVEWHTSFTDSVFELLKPYVKERNLTIEDAAELLNFSVRSFQRRLSNENTSFRRIKENLMFSVACEIMEEGHSLTYIASQLGYANISQFSRAFKRISGLTPKVYQKTILENA